MVPATVNESDNAAEGAGERRRKLVRLSLWFTAIMLGVAPVFVAVGYWRFQAAGAVSALAAGAVCWLGGVAALGLAGLLSGPQAAVGSLLGGMFFRAGVPFIFGMVAQQRPGILAEGRIFGMVLAYYFVALLAETLMSLRLVPQKPHSAIKAKAL